MNQRKLSLILVVLVALGLLFGGAAHSSHHADEGGDCHACNVTVLPAVAAAPVVSKALPPTGDVVELSDRIPVHIRRDSDAARAPPAV